jgi:hypothetical protein
MLFEDQIFALQIGQMAKINNAVTIIGHKGGNAISRPQVI